jgi:RNA polymerase sigma-70 factor (ECF subfamily)
MPISRKAFEKRVLDLLPTLHGVARRLTCGEADAEDLVAEAVARAWHARDALEEESAFRAWIFRILHNSFISDKRRLAARTEVATGWDTEEGDEEETRFSIFEQMHQPFLLWFSNPEQQFLDKVLREDLERALCALPEHHRIVVVLSDLEDFTYAEIATALDIPVGTVRSRLARARGALQQILWKSAQEYGLDGAAVKARAEAASTAAKDQA